jgi:XapX domain-containing protein
MIKLAFGFLLALMIGAGCRWLDIPAPSPPKLVGALLVVAMTIGYSGADWLLTRSGRIATTSHLCGGPTGMPIAQRLPPNPAPTAPTEEPGPPPSREESGG